MAIEGQFIKPGTYTYPDMHRVNGALIKIFNTADTWAQIEECAQAALHVHLKADLMRKEHQRSMQEGSQSGCSEDAPPTPSWEGGR